MIDFDTQDKYPLPSVRAWFRERTAGWDWHEWMSIAWCLIMVGAMAVLVFNASCVSGYAEQKKNQAKQTIGVGVEKVSNMTFGVTAPPEGNAFGPIYSASWVLIAVSVVSLVLSFVPIVRLFFEARKSAITTGLIGIGGLCAYTFVRDLFDDWGWVLYIGLALGAGFALYSYLPAIKSPKRFAEACWELVTRKDSNKDGRIGPKWR